jgi:putative serine protease PepD
MPAPHGGGRTRQRGTAGMVVVALIAGIVGGGIGVGGEYLVTGGGSAGAPALTASPTPGGSGKAKPGSVEYAATVTGKSTVDIKVHGRQSGDEGTGIALSSDGKILTNNHVVALAQKGGRIQVTLPNGKQTSAKVVGTAPSYDLAVIRASNASGLTPAQLGQSKGVRVGQQVAAVGTPYGLAGTVTSGIISARHRTVTVQSQNGKLVVYSGLQTDAPINPGNSGGPLVNLNGQVIGVNSAINNGGGSSASGGKSGSIGLGFAIPIDTARRVANDIIQQGYATKPVLGVVGHPGKGNGQGAPIARVTKGSAAAKAGIKSGAVITKVNEHPLQNYTDLMAAILEYAPGQQVTMALKGGKTVHVTLGSQKDTAQTTVKPPHQSPFGGLPFGGPGGH